VKTGAKGELKEPERFGKSILFRTCLAQDYHDLWIAIAGDALRANYLPEMGKFRNLFKSTEIASRLEFIITLCSLYDTDSRAVSISRWAKHVWRANGSPQSWKSKFKRASAKAGKLYLLRNNYFAHVSDHTFKQNLFVEAGLTYRDLSDLMADTWNLVSDLAGITDNRPNDRVVTDLQVLFPKIKLPLGWANSTAP
jgi:hypothetical protein